MAGMLHSRRLALQYHWWAWDHARIRAATKATCLDHLLTIVDDILERNRQLGDRPGTWAELAHRVYLRRDQRNPQRWSQSRYMPPPHAMLGLATVRALPPEPQVLGSGSRARVVEVTFESGEGVIIPRANVEVIEQ